MRTYVRVLSGEASGKAVLLDNPLVTCGRHCENDLMLPDDDVSRHHCRLVLVSGSTYRIEDAGSSNGTYVNNSLVRSKTLALGDQIRVGRTLLEIVSTEEDSLDKNDLGDRLGESSFDAGLGPEIGTLITELNSPVESYPEVTSEQDCSDLKADLDFVYRASAITSADLTLEGLCHHLVKLVGDWAGVRQALLVLLQENEEDFFQTFAWQTPTEDSFTQSDQQPKLNFNRRLVDRVHTSRLPTMVTFEVSLDRPDKVTAMCVPVDNGQKLFGFIYVDDFQGFDDQSGEVFSNRGLEVLAAIGKQAAAAIENNACVRSALNNASQKAVGKLTSVVSHRINNLMHLVSGGEFLMDAGFKSNDLKQVASGWGTVRRAQNRIGQLSTDMAWHCRKFEPLMRATKPLEIIDLVVNEMIADYGESRLNVVNRVDPNLSLNLASHYFDRAVRNVLAVSFWAAEHGPVGQDTVTLETELSGDWFVARVSFRHFDDRFDLVGLGKGEIDSINAEFGFLEMVVAQKIMASQAGSLACSTDLENQNTIEVRLPLISKTTNVDS